MKVRNIVNPITLAVLTTIGGFISPHAIAQQDTTHQADVYVEGSMCIGSDSTDCTIGTGSSTVRILLDNAGPGADMLEVENSGPARILLTNTRVGTSPNFVTALWRMTNDVDGNIRLSDDETDTNTEFLLDRDGNLTITGALYTETSTYPDYVFKDGYELMPMEKLETFIKQNGHLPNIPSQADVEKSGKVNISELQVKMLEKIEELTLYTLDQQKTIAEQRKSLEGLQHRLAALETKSK